MINLTEQEEKAKKNSINYTSTAVVIGIILVVVGCIVVLSNVGIISVGLRHFLISWQMLLIVLGTLGLVKGNKTAGTILLLLGLFFILPKISILWPSVTAFGHNFTRNFWPLLIILFGLIMIITSRKNTNFIGSGKTEYSTSNMNNNDGYINYNFLFGGTEQVFAEPVFKGGNIRATFGGVTLDLRNSSLPENGPAILNIETTFGGTTIIVPEQWNVEISQNSLFGGFTDKRYRCVASSNSNQKLIINAKCTFGGGELK